jgi:hypothetical protein
MDAAGNLEDYPLLEETSTTIIPCIYLPLTIK